MKLSLSVIVLSALLSGGCFAQHAVSIEPITVAPLQVTMDVNLHVEHSADEAAADVLSETEEGASVDGTAGGSASDDRASGDRASGGGTGHEVTRHEEGDDATSGDRASRDRRLGHEPSRHNAERRTDDPTSGDRAASDGRLGHEPSRHNAERRPSATY